MPVYAGISPTLTVGKFKTMDFVRFATLRKISRYLVEGGVVLVGRPGHNKLGVGHLIVVLTSVNDLLHKAFSW